jgi:hypothetical protein
VKKSNHCNSNLKLFFTVTLLLLLLLLLSLLGITCIQDTELYIYIYIHISIRFFSCFDSPQWAMSLPCRNFWITLRHTTLGRTSLDKWLAHRRDLYLTTHNMHERQTSMPPGGIRTRSLSKQVAADPRHRLRGHWDQHTFDVVPFIFLKARPEYGRNKTNRNMFI